MVYGGGNWEITIEEGLGNDVVSGKFRCVYENRQYNTNPTQSSYRWDNECKCWVDGSITLIDLGTAPIVFKKVEAKQK